MTQFRFGWRGACAVLAVLGAAGAVARTGASGDDLEAAQKAREEARATYYQRLKQLKRPTDEDRERLKREVLGPAEARVERVSREEGERVRRQKWEKREEADTPNADAATDPNAHVSARGRGATPLPAGPGEHPQAPPEDVAVPDGPDTPEEIIFTGPKKKKEKGTR